MTRDLYPLPPEQREQALKQLGQIQGQGSRGSELSSLAEEAGVTADEKVSQTDEDEIPAVDPRARENSRLVINFDQRPFLDEQELEEIENDPVLRRIAGSRYY